MLIYCRVIHKFNSNYRYLYNISSNISYNNTHLGEISYIVKPSKIDNSNQIDIKVIKNSISTNKLTDTEELNNKKSNWGSNY